jgi:hypothetical protein
VPKFEEGSRLTEFASFSDEQVIARVVAGETALFEELMRRFNQCVYRVARAIVKDEGEAEDVMRQAYLNGFTHLRQFEERAKFSTWQRASSSTRRSAAAASCHVPPLFTEPGWAMHTADEIGIDDFQASRSPDGRYRTTPLKGLWAHAKGGYYHDGRYPTLLAVVQHYNQTFNLRMSDGEMNDLVEYLKSL